MKIFRPLPVAAPRYGRSREKRLRFTKGDGSTTLFDWAPLVAFQEHLSALLIFFETYLRITDLPSILRE